MTFYDAFLAETQSGTPGPVYRNRERQNTMLQLAIDVLIDIDERQEILRNLIRSGQHMQYSLDEYGRFFDVLIQVARQHDARAWTPELELAWQEIKAKAMAVIQGVLLENSSPTLLKET